MSALSLTDILLIALLVVLLVGTGITVWLLQRRMRELQLQFDEQVDDPLQRMQQYLYDSLQYSNAQQHQNTESLRQQITQQQVALQQQFDSVNKQVDTKLGDNTQQISQRLDNSARFLQQFQQDVAKFNLEMGRIRELGTQIEKYNKMLLNNKKRGGMGEETLIDLLANTFPSQRYSVQHALANGAVVDAAIFTSNGTIPIDAKFPFAAYEKMLESGDGPAMEEAEKQLTRDVKARINETAKYILTDAGTVDFALLFLPNESLYYEVAIRNAPLSHYAREKRVLLVGPGTLFYALRIIYQAYQSQEFAKQAQQVIAELHSVRQYAAQLEGEIQLAKKQLGQAGNNLDSALRTNDKLQGQVEKVMQLGTEDIAQPALFKPASQ
ncbi:DNA recombination protein RmuC [Candidatus Peribacteria bacterium]|nr:DNA recombination protein RmuC [Candidatus Peribacteria bacterium]